MGGKTEEWERAIIHIDMDAFFAAIEIRDNPKLAGKPVIIGGDPKSRGVVSTCSYEARKYGVHSAMSCSEAYRRCPRAIFLRGRHAHYSAVSSKIHSLFNEFTPLVMPLSCDEAFLDVTGMERLFGPPEVIAEKLRGKIFERVGLTASAGVAGTMFVAKIASDMNKPDGLTVIRDNEVITRLAPLSVGRIWGLGKVGVKKVNSLGIKYIGDLQLWPEKELINALGSIGEQLYRLCRGIDERVITGLQYQEKSISNEVTFASDILSIAELDKYLLGLADKVARRSRQHGLLGRTVQLKVKYADFKQVTRRVTLSAATASSQTLYNIVRELLRNKTEAAVRPIRLVGVGLSGFDSCSAEEGGVQESLFADQEKVIEDSIGNKMSQVDATADIIAEKFGDNKLLSRGTLIFKK